MSDRAARSAPEHLTGPGVRMVVDEENNAETWWDAVHRAPNVPAELAPLVKTVVSEVEVPIESAARLRAWCESLPGWADGPEYARTPLRFYHDA